VTPLVPSHFSWNDSLFLQVTFEGQVQLPRTTFTATPYAFAVNSIDGAQGGIINGSISLHSELADDEVAGLYLDGSGNPNLWMKDVDGNNQIKLDAATRSLALTDGVVTSTPATITSTGDTLVLGNGKVKVNAEIVTVAGQLDISGSTSCWINPNATGYQSVHLPEGGINAWEIDDEPGIAQVTFADTVALVGTDYVNLVTLGVNLPASGFLLVTGSVQCYMKTGSGYAMGNLQISFSTNPPPADNDPTVNSFTITNGTKSNFSVSRLYHLLTGQHQLVIRGNRTFGQNVYAVNGTRRALFIPSWYGTSDPSSPAATSQDIVPIE
jgi:hypothetical protein